jgi:hypothetical protein
MSAFLNFKEAKIGELEVGSWSRKVEVKSWKLEVENRITGVDAKTAIYTNPSIEMETGWLREQ